MKEYLVSIDGSENCREELEVINATLALLGVKLECRGNPEAGYLMRVKLPEPVEMPFIAKNIESGDLGKMKELPMMTVQEYYYSRFMNTSIGAIAKSVGVSPKTLIKRFEKTRCSKNTDNRAFYAWIR